MGSYFFLVLAESHQRVPNLSFFLYWFGCVCMCVYVYVCVCVCTCICICATNALR